MQGKMPHGHSIYLTDAIISKLRAFWECWICISPSLHKTGGLHLVWPLHEKSTHPDINKLGHLEIKIQIMSHNTMDVLM